MSKNRSKPDKRVLCTLGCGAMLSAYAAKTHDCTIAARQRAEMQAQIGQGIKRTYLQGHDRKLYEDAGLRAQKEDGNGNG